LKETGYLKGYIGQGKKVHYFAPVAFTNELVYSPLCNYLLSGEEVFLTNERVTCKICLRVMAQGRKTNA